MSHGLEVFDAAGVKVLGPSDRLSKFHSTVVITRATNTWNAIDEWYDELFWAVPGMTDDGTWAVQSPNTIYWLCRVGEGGFHYTFIYPGSPTFMVWRV